MKAVEQAKDLAAGEPVSHERSLTITNHEARLAKHGEVLREIRLAAVQDVGKMHHVGAFVAQERQDLQANRVGKGVRDPRGDIGVARVPRASP